MAWVGYVGGGYVTPKLAAKAATWHWQSLPSNAGRRKDNRPYPGEIETIEVSPGQSLVVETWGSAGPLVYLVHGWGGWRGQVAAFVKPLVDKGFTVVSADSPSHGDSPPGRFGPTHSTGGEMIDAFEAMVSAVGQPYAIIGHSLGCATAAQSIVSGRATAERLVLIASSPEMRRQSIIFGKSLGFNQRTIRLMHDLMGQRTGRGFEDFDVALMAGSGKLPSGLVVHDQADKEVAYQVGLDIANAWPNATLFTTTGLGHHRILIDSAVVDQVTAFIGDPPAARTEEVSAK